MARRSERESCEKLRHHIYNYRMNTSWFPSGKRCRRWAKKWWRRMARRRAKMQLDRGDL
jgi:hypothetical protein